MTKEFQPANQVSLLALAILEIIIIHYYLYVIKVYILIVLLYSTYNLLQAKRTVQYLIFQNFQKNVNSVPWHYFH
jgi:hypothetical protein